MKNLPSRPGYQEEKYIEYDDENGMWGLFGERSGFCYHLELDKEELENWIKKQGIKCQV